MLSQRRPEKIHKVLIGSRPFEIQITSSDVDSGKLRNNPSAHNYEWNLPSSNDYGYNNDSGELGKNPESS